MLSGHQFEQHNAQRKQIGPAIDSLREGRSLMREVGDSRGEALCLHAQGECLKLLGKLEEADEAYEEARRRFEPCGDLLGFGRSQMGLADVARRRGRLDEARRLLEESIDLMRRIGNRYSEGVGLNTLGDIARNQGRVDDARALYERSIGVLDAIASEEALIVRLNLGLVFLAQRDFAAARALFEAARPELSEAGREGFLTFVVAGLFAAAVGLRDFDAAARTHPELTALLGQSGIVDDDLAATLELAGDESAAAGRGDWATVAWALTLIVVARL